MNLVDKIIKRDPAGNIIGVDWKKLNESDDKDDFLNALIKDGILSDKRKNNYIIIGSEFLLNPRLRYIIPLNFTDEENAKDYAKAVYGNATYAIRHLKNAVIYVAKIIERVNKK